MADLPEVETIRRDLEKEIAGLKIKAVELPGAGKMFKGARPKGVLAERLAGRKIVSVTRAGTLLDFHLGDDESLMVDLGPNAYFRRAKNTDDKLGPERMVIAFATRGQLRLIDPDQASVVRIVHADRFQATYPEMTELGFDPVENPMPWPDFGRMIASEQRDLYTLLRDPTFVVGLGPIYTDEVLHAALLRHDRIASELNTQEVRRLHRAILEVVYNAVKRRGTGLGGRLDVYGEPGKYDPFLEVYGRGGERSRNGRGKVQTTELDGNVHHYCDYQV